MNIFDNKLIIVYFVLDKDKQLRYMLLLTSVFSMSTVLGLCINQTNCMLYVDISHYERLALLHVFS